MSWPHILSISRIVAAAPVAALILVAHGATDFWAAGVFAVASLTDLLDGPLARRGSTVGPFGIYLDTTGDKVLVSVVLIAMASTRIVDPWIVMVIVGREFLVTGVRTLGAVEGHVITANFAGKVKTVATLIAMIYLLLITGVREGDAGISSSTLTLWKDVGWFAMLAVVVLTLYSGGRYIIAARPLFFPAGQSVVTAKGVRSRPSDFKPT